MCMEMIQGFVGLSNEYMEGIFVSDEMQSCGIGKLLLEYHQFTTL